jgi:ribosomal protein S18 acetylase RimI-like enzyme
MTEEMSPGNIRYSATLDAVAPEQIAGFFVGWQHPLGGAEHLRMLVGSDFTELAIDEASGRVVGFVAALSDGVQGAFITLLEVLPDYQGRGIGQELMERMLQQLSHIQTIELMCDTDLIPFYERFGMSPTNGMVLRRRAP